MTAQQPTDAPHVGTVYPDIRRRPTDAIRASMSERTIHFKFIQLESFPPFNGADPRLDLLAGGLPTSLGPRKSRRRIRSGGAVGGAGGPALSSTWLDPGRLAPAPGGGCRPTGTRSLWVTGTVRRARSGRRRAMRGPHRRHGRESYCHRPAASPWSPSGVRATHADGGGQMAEERRPPTPDVDPLAFDRETMRRMGYLVVDRLVERIASLGDERVLTTASRAEALAAERLANREPSGPRVP
jgi:hypothetical protein